MSMRNRRAGLALSRDLEQRLARRREVEAAIRGGERMNTHREPLLLRDHVAAPILRAALQVTGLYSRGIRNALDVAVRQIRFEFENVPGTFDGIRILHLADLHIDGVDGLAEVIAERVSGLNTDLCVMTGDYRFAVDGPCDQVYPRLETILAHIHAPGGVFAILGNHDEAEMAVELEHLGVRMLINEAVEITRGGDGLWLTGVDDPHRYGCDDLEAACEGVPADAFKVLLAHSPEMFDQASAAGIDLYLCGHTHAGQIRVPGIGAPLLNAACPRPYTHGCWKHEAMQGYTSAGAGCSLLPVRYNCPPEITVIEIAKRDSA